MSAAPESKQQDEHVGHGREEFDQPFKVYDDKEKNEMKESEKRSSEAWAKWKAAEKQGEDKDKVAQLKEEAERLQEEQKKEQSLC